MPWEVAFHPDLLAELPALTALVRVELIAHANLIAEFGPTLGRLAVDTLKGSQIVNLKELRFTADGGVWRVAFAFDGNRVAVLLVAGDKKGKDQRLFYKRLVKQAEQRFETWGE